MTPQGTAENRDIEFENIFLTVKSITAYKKIIRGVSGKFKSGELTAIMGPSGAGKTSLLNILTGYQKSGIQGIIKCSNERGKKRKKASSDYRNYSCYILQDDHLLDYFTVYEIMYYTTKLKIGGLSREENDFLIDDILSTLGLIKQKRTPCGSLSGGQKKRLSIALELIDDPPIMFLDEPTTGLDSNSSRQCIEMLKSLAQKGRTIICTIHQPSAPLYMTFDHVYIMAQGKCIYQGLPQNTISFLASAGYICPQYHNPADFLMEVANGEYGDSVDILSLAKESCLCKVENVLQYDQNSNETWKRDSCHPSSFYTNYSTISASEGNFIKEQKDKEKDMSIEPAIITREILLEDPECCIRKKPSEWTRFLVLFQKQLIYFYRDWTVARIKLILHFLVGIFLGVTFQNSGYNASKFITNLSFFMVSVVYLSYTALMPAALRFPSELKILRKEHFNRWYKLRTYYASFLAADFPLQILFTLAYTIGSYTISSQPLEIRRFLMVFLIHSMATLVSAGIGTMFGTIVNPVNGTFLGAILTAVNICFGGFLCLFPQMNNVMYYLSNLSYMRFCMESILQAIYGFNRGKLICPEEEEYCMFTNPNEVLHEIGMDECSYWTDFGWLIVNLLVFRLLGYCALKYKVK
ncbi:ATP-binding cassette sub-family G member 1-like isoform X2 [Sitophilus oryzae]|uniref:ATP-binding cassette sub-family G member 1-like isoform X2 n=1 Tax=Sitophilus oryzae TaxID=7048 RepID=A0A6J2XE04_SITOR|nr:ATP-binding cassette sub-family G member 1-like isoform X2 [Sitophilus oryzae]